MIAALRRVPLPACALALGVASLGNLLGSYSATVRLCCGALAAAIVVLVVLRIIVDLSGVRRELGNAAIAAVFPTLFMATMVLATYLEPHAAAGAKAIWLTALSAQLLYVAVFFFRFVIGFDIEKVLPSWFVVFVGFVVASVTSPAFSMQPLGRLLLGAGLIGYGATLPVVVARLRTRPLPAPAWPTMAIFAAPVSLCLAGYLAVAETGLEWVAYAMLAASITSLFGVITHLPAIIRTGFSPSFSALTFPFVITAIALKQSAAFLGTIPPHPVVAMEVFATGMVAYVLLGYLGLGVRAAVVLPAVQNET